MKWQQSLQNEYRPWLMIAGTSLVLLLMNFSGLEPRLYGLIERTLHPASQLSFIIFSFFHQPFLAVKDSLVSSRHIQNLEARYSECLALSSEINGLKEENASLRQMLENADRSLSTSIIAAPIVAYGTPFIDRGEAENITAGDLVLVANTLVGRVSKTSPHQSQVVLLNQLDGQPLLVKTDSQAQGLIRGNGKKIELTEIPKETVINIGEKIVTVGQEGVAPGIFVGRVQDIKEDVTAPTQTASVEQLVSFYETRVVEVRKN
jgi:rod shape-determining protein MreC